jgi:hypothetical protein
METADVTAVPQKHPQRRHFDPPPGGKALDIIGISDQPVFPGIECFVCG